MDRRFDLISWLRHRGIPFSEEGRNVSSGWIEVSCPWCDDPSFHLGINLETQFINCWRCPAKGHVSRFVGFIEKCERERAYHIMAKFPDHSLPKLKSEILYNYVDETRNPLPKKLPPNLSSSERDYLIQREFDPDHLVKEYGIRGGPSTGRDKFRIIIPIFFNGKIVSYTALDTTGAATSKYKHCRNEDSIYPIKHLVYNIDRVRDTVLIMEGVTDVWRIDCGGGVAVFGVEVRPEQILAIKEKRPLKAFIMFDGEKEAYKKAEELAERLDGIIPKVEVVKLRDGTDPGDLRGEELTQVKELLF